MSMEDSWPITADAKPMFARSGFDSSTGIYHSLEKLGRNMEIPTTNDLDTFTYMLSQLPNELDKIALIDASTNNQLSYAKLLRSVRALAAGLYHGLGVRKGDIVFVLSPNSILYPTICLAIFALGAILSPSNPINTETEISKQILDCGATLVISAPEELHKLTRIGVPVMLTVTTRSNYLSVEELIESCDPIEFPQARITQSDTAAILYSSGTTGTSKGVVLTHSNFIAIMTLMKWSIYSTSSQNDVFLCFIPIFHIYGLAFFALGLLCAGITTVIMKKFDLEGMLEAIQTHRVNNLPAVPPVILGLVKYATKLKSELSCLRRVGSGAAPLSKELTKEFRKIFPWMELRQGYGLTETCGAATFFALDGQAKAHPGSCGRLLPCFIGKVVDYETGLALPPCREGEVWIKSPTIMQGYLNHKEATAETLSSDGWLKTGDLGYFDEDGFLYIVDRIKELIKHNGYQVAPAELEAVLLSHPELLDAAVIPIEDEEAGQIPMAYVVRAAGAGSELTEEQIMQFVASQVAPYKKVRKVGFIRTIPKSAAGKILRKELVLYSRQQSVSKL